MAENAPGRSNYRYEPEQRAESIPFFVVKKQFDNLKSGKKAAEKRQNNISAAFVAFLLLFAAFINKLLFF